MTVLNGKGISKGMALGKLIFYTPAEKHIEKRTVTNVQNEIVRLEKAKQSSLKELQKIYEKALKIMSKKNADIFKAHILLLDSPDFFEDIVNIITTDCVCAEYAVYTIAQKLMKKLKTEEMKSPINDIKDVSQTLIRNLANEKFNDIIGSEKVIICANDLVPSQILEFNKANVSGFCLINSDRNSHTAIIAKSMNIPAIVCIEQLTEKYMGNPALIDGEKGMLFIEPNSETIKRLFKY
ncbi:MAG: hypothetical protein K2F81_08180 [Ruminococcus sp.]|nr:hypothetical protein [Ruminococcus sp.]